MVGADELVSIKRIKTTDTKTWFGKSSTSTALVETRADETRAGRR